MYEELLQARWVERQGQGQGQGEGGEGGGSTLDLGSQVDYANERMATGKPFYEPTWMAHTRKAGGVFNQ